MKYLFTVATAAALALAIASTDLNVPESLESESESQPVTRISTSPDQWLHQKGFDFRYFSSDRDNMEVDVIISAPDDDDDESSDASTSTPILGESKTSLANSTFTSVRTSSSSSNTSQISQTNVFKTVSSSLVETSSHFMTTSAPLATFSLSFESNDHLNRTEVRTSPSYEPSPETVMSISAPAQGQSHPTGTPLTSVARTSFSPVMPPVYATPRYENPYGYGYGYPAPYGYSPGYPGSYSHPIGYRDSISSIQEYSQPESQSRAQSSTQLQSPPQSAEDASSEEFDDNMKLGKRGIISDFFDGTRGKNKKVNPAVNYAPPPLQAPVQGYPQVAAYQPCTQSVRVQAVQPFMQPVQVQAIPRINDVYTGTGYYYPPPPSYVTSSYGYGYGYGYPQPGDIADDVSNWSNGILSEAVDCMMTLLNPATYCPGLASAPESPSSYAPYYPPTYYQPYYQQPVAYQQPSQLLVSYAPPQQQCYYVATPSCENSCIAVDGDSPSYVQPPEESPAAPLSPVTTSLYTIPMYEPSRTTSAILAQPTSTDSSGINSGDSKGEPQGQASDNLDLQELVAQAQAQTNKAQALLTEQLGKQTTSSDPSSNHQPLTNQQETQGSHLPQHPQLHSSVLKNVKNVQLSRPARLNVFPPNERVPVSYL